MYVECCNYCTQPIQTFIQDCISEINAYHSKLSMFPYDAFRLYKQFVDYLIKKLYEEFKIPQEPSNYKMNWIKIVEEQDSIESLNKQMKAMLGDLFDLLNDSQNEDKKTIIKAKTVIKRLPKSVTSQRGMLAQNPTSETASAISEGKVTDAPVSPPTLLAAVATIPAQISNIDVISSMP